MKTIKNLTIRPLDHRGINMVDLMMWLVIAALLLATALQSIGYYQKNANVYLMKQEADVVASRVMAETSDRGSIDSLVIDKVIAEENAARPNDNITVSWGESGAVASSTAAPVNNYGFELASAVTATPDLSSYFIKVTHTAVKDTDVVYFLDDTTSNNAGVNMVKKDSLGAGTGAPEGKPVNGACYAGQWKVSYFDSYNFATSTPHSVNCENGSDTSFKAIFNTGGTKYQPERVDNFSLRYEREITIPATGDYTFTTKGDDYISVFIDGVRIQNTVWNENVETVTVKLTQGTHKLKLEMTDGVSTGNLEFSFVPAS